MCSVTYGSGVRNQGMCFTTGSFQSSLPSSTSSPTAHAVNALLMLAMKKMLFGVTGSSLARSSLPYPLLHTNSPFCTMPTDSPGWSNSFTALAMYASSATRSGACWA